MTKSVDLQNLAVVKIALAEKYENLAKCAKSVVKQRQFANYAIRYRRQAAALKTKAAW